MGQKSNPIGLRLQVNRTWDSRWFAEGQDYGRMLVEDLKIRQYVFKNLPQAAISKVVIERRPSCAAFRSMPPVRASSSARRARTSKSFARSSVN